MDDLNKGREQIAAQRLQIIDAREKGVDGADITIFNIEIARIRKEVTSPAAVELEFGAWRFSVKPAAIGVKAAYPGFVAPALATSVDRIPAGERWIHEIKFDGYRVQVHLVNEAIKVFTRRGHDWPHPPLSSGLSQIRLRAFGATSHCSGRWNTILTSHFDLLDASFPESGWGYSVNNQFEEPGGPQSANALRIFSVNSRGLRTCERHQSLRPCDVDVWPLFERSDMGLDEG
jgi:hypothetical protein